MTIAKEQFNKTIHRCKEQVLLYSKLKELQEQGNLTDITLSQDILRGAIVLAVAAFDSYATDCFSEKFIPYIKRYNVDHSLEALLVDAGFDVKFSLDLVQSDRPYRKIRTLITKYYSRYTTQKLDVIDKLFLQYHLQSITKRAAERSGKKRLLRSVEVLILRRHEIVHNGDYNDHRRIKNVADRDIKRIDDLQILVDNIEAIVQNKFS